LKSGRAAEVSATVAIYSAARFGRRRRWRRIGY
jgi:hypothetical protein